MSWHVCHEVAPKLKSHIAADTGSSCSLSSMRSLRDWRTKEFPNQRLPLLQLGLSKATNNYFIAENNTLKRQAPSWAQPQKQSHKIHSAFELSLGNVHSFSLGDLENSRVSSTFENVSTSLLSFEHMYTNLRFVLPCSETHLSSSQLTVWALRLVCN